VCGALLWSRKKKDMQVYLYKNKTWWHCKEEGISPLNAANICVCERDRERERIIDSRHFK